MRVALGATPRSITQLVVREGIVMALVGSFLGLAAALTLNGVMRSLVFGVSPLDIASLGAGTLTLLAVAALASYLPARRAARIDPAVALRAE